MKIAKTLRTPGVCAVSLALGMATIQAPVMADMVGTKDIAMQAEVQMQRADIHSIMARDDVREIMLGYGVSPDDVNNRINNMTPAELMQLQSQIDQLPAGGALGFVLGLILIFIVLDLLGVTNIFPRI